MTEVVDDKALQLSDYQVFVTNLLVRERRNLNKEAIPATKPLDQSADDVFV